tara:strand:- start:837 stop:1172 length:336 start_codon:yes stop_codon:yes gene_type:complete
MVKRKTYKEGGQVKERTKENSFVKKFQEDMPLGIGKILTPIESSGIGEAYKKITKKIVDKVAKKKVDKKTSNMQPLKKPSVTGLKAGGLVKKKSIDGIAKRGKTKLKRVKG